VKRGWIERWGKRVGGRVGRGDAEGRAVRGGGREGVGRGGAGGRGAR